MFRVKDLVLLIVTFSSMLLGVLFPNYVRFFRPLPLYCMMSILFLSFLSIKITDVLGALRGDAVKIAVLLLLKLIFLPIIVFFLFQALCPAYTLAAFLLSGISTGVVSPFFADLLKARSSVVLVMVVVSSMLVPFSLPPLVSLFFGQDMEIPLLGMMRLLFLVIFVPIFLVEVLRRSLPDLTDFLKKRQYPLILVIFAIANMGIFSEYADFFYRKPMTIVAAFLVSVALAIFYFLSGLLFSWGRPLQDQLSVIISFGIMNNVLVLIFSSQFFGPIEPTVAAIYTIPFYGLILPLRFYRNLRLRASRKHHP